MGDPITQPAIKRISWIVWGLLLLVVLALGSAFAHAWALHETLDAKREVLIPMVTAQMIDRATLQAQLTVVQSDDYASEWAQEEAGMTEPGMVLVQPVGPTFTPVPSPTPIPEPTPTPTSLPFWQRWWQTLTGQQP